MDIKTENSPNAVPVVDKFNSEITKKMILDEKTENSPRTDMKQYNTKNKTKGRSKNNKPKFIYNKLRPASGTPPSSVCSPAKK